MASKQPFPALAAALVLVTAPPLPFLRAAEAQFEVLDEEIRGRPVKPRYSVATRSGATVVTIHAGRKPTGGYEVEVLGVERQGKACTVRYRVTAPPPDAIVTQALTFPAVAIRVAPPACGAVAVNPPITRAPR